MATNKKATKKTGKAQAKQGYSNTLGGGVLAQAPSVVPLPDARKAFDAALEKVQGIRAVLVTTPDDGRPVNDEVLANRARRLADAVSNLQHHAWTLRESAYAEADK